jgi:hypothetical protein
MAPEATLPHSDVNVPGDYFSLAGFEVTTYGRIWVTPEGPLSLGERSVTSRRVWRGVSAAVNGGLSVVLSGD